MYTYCIYQIITTKNIGESKLKHLSYENLDDESVIDNALLAENDGPAIKFINVAAYVGGYLIRRLRKIHSKESITECKFCCLLLSEVDLDIYLFCTFKEYEGDSKKEHLNYCSKRFLNLLMKWDKIFLFNDLELIIIVNSGKIYLIPHLCDDYHSIALVRLFVRVKIYRQIKIINYSVKKKLH